MQRVHLSHILVEDRQRQEISSKELIELKRSIVSKGLLHAPVLSTADPESSTYRLIAGERRYRAMCELHEEGLAFSYNGEAVPADYIPFARISDLSLADLQEAELEENILRMPLTWMEEAEAKLKIHQLRTQRAASEGQPPPTQVSTAKHIAAARGTDPATVTSKSPEVLNLHRSIMVAEHASDPDVKAAKNLSQAWSAILRKKEALFKSILAERTGSSNENFKLIKGDCTEELDRLEPSTFDIIFCDPPYGINADTMKHDSKHHYDDTPEAALKVCKAIIAKGFSLCKPKATLFLWCDFEHFITLRDFASMQGWVPWRVPLVWHKGPQGHAPWGRAGFVRTYEILLFAVKGQRELYIPGGSDVITAKSTAPGAKRHAAEKPIEIIRLLLEKASIEGDKVLDPCCGSGVIFEAAYDLKLQATGIELSTDYYNLSMARIGDLDNVEEPRESYPGDRELEDPIKGGPKIDLESLGLDGNDPDSLDL